MKLASLLLYFSLNNTKIELINFRFQSIYDSNLTMAILIWWKWLEWFWLIGFCLDQFTYAMKIWHIIFFVISGSPLYHFYVNYSLKPILMTEYITLQFQQLDTINFYTQTILMVDFFLRRKRRNLSFQSHALWITMYLA